MTRLFHLAVLTLLIGAGPVVAQDIKPGVERWPVKTSIAPDADVNQPTQITFDDLAQLADPLGVGKNDPRYQSKRIPNTREGEIVALRAWIQLVAGEKDGDYHIQITKDERGFLDCLIVEVPNSDPRFTRDPNLQPLFQAVRQAVKTGYLQGREPSSTGSILKPVLMQFTGQLFYDDAHVGDQPRGKKGCKALSLWEIHPIAKAEAVQ